MKYLFLLFILFTLIHSSAQNTRLTKRADSLYRANDHQNAAATYLLAANSLQSFQNPKSLLYNAACSYALIGEHEKSIDLLKKAVHQYGFRNLDLMERDNDLTSLKEDTRWKELISFLVAQRNAMANPGHAKLVTSDIHHFWEAYDAIQKDTGKRKEIFIEKYFNRASPGLQDYFTSKIGSVEAFVQNQVAKQKFYAAIRPHTLAIEGMKDTIYSYFNKLKYWYEDAIFPDIYFLIGRWNSAGTVSDNGLLLGIDQISRTSNIPQEELNLWEKNNFQDLEMLPVIIVHEQIHFQQQKIREDTTLLFYALVEGMADFICELITGANPSQRQHDFAKTRKKQIWEDFKKEMYLNRAYNWIANSSQERPDHPADLGYYVGYEICKSFFDNAIDKKAAIREMFEIQDHKSFLEKSGYEEKLKNL